MNHRQHEVEVNTATNGNSIEGMLQVFWEKAKAAAALITQLREEQRTLSDKLTVFERELNKIRGELSQKEQEVKRLRAENAQLTNANGQAAFTEEEKELLKSRIRDLIAKINSHL